MLFLTNTDIHQSAFSWNRTSFAQDNEIRNGPLNHCNTVYASGIEQSALTQWKKLPFES